MTKTAAVLGAGLQGCCAALALQRQGFSVKLFDKSHTLMNRASLNQEGKIHLGFVYARDPSMITARKMIEHALQFAPAIESLVGIKLNWEPHLSTRFQCGIHHDSTLTKEEHFSHFNALQRIFEELSERPGWHYLGRRFDRLWSLNTDGRFQRGGLTDSISTEETAVHTKWMRQVIVDAIELNSAITGYLSHTVQDVKRVNQDFIVSGKNTSGLWNTRADIVVNCLWEGQQQIDHAMGFNVQTEWITRVKYGFVLKSIPELYDLPSLIVTHGPFGDIVNYPFDNTIYLTWYPACLAYIGQSAILPEHWEEACEGNHDQQISERIFTETLDKLSKYVPKLRGLTLQKVLAGTIMGHGHTDISDPESGLHRRHGIGVEADGDYYSIFTGKYTSAPANAMELQNMLS